MYTNSKPLKTYFRAVMYAHNLLTLAESDLQLRDAASQFKNVESYLERHYLSCIWEGALFHRIGFHTSTSAHNVSFYWFLQELNRNSAPFLVKSVIRRYVFDVLQRTNLAVV